ncbi:hypothetical protein, partial [Nostoc sp.]|uniref:hypothetical protein n=1 Tax=Nostoc sp. TaxID=1180 RepID=UPI002FF773EE
YFFVAPFSDRLLYPSFSNPVPVSICHLWMSLKQFSVNVSGIAIAPHSSSQLIQMFYISTDKPQHPYTTSIL